MNCNDESYFCDLVSTLLCYVEVLLHSNDMLLLNYDIQYKYIFQFLMCQHKSYQKLSETLNAKKWTKDSSRVV